MTLHEYPDLQQGTEEWHTARRGIVTASVVGSLVTARSMGAFDYDCPACGARAQMPCVSKVKKADAAPTVIKTTHPERAGVAIENRATSPLIIEPANDETSRGVTLRLVAERIAGFTEDTSMTGDMWRGVESEPIARDIYSGYYQQAVEFGFLVREEKDWTLGYSPDGLVADDGLIEIKSPRAKTHLSTILADEIPAHHMAQIQAGLLVSGRKWCDFISYCGGMHLYPKRVLPDLRWFEAITAACQQFETTAAEMTAAYEKTTKNMPATERVDHRLEF